MPNTTKIQGSIIEITGLDEDWDWAEECTDLKDAIIRGGLKISSIRFDPSAKDDVMVIKEYDGSGAVLFYKKTASVYDNTPFYYNGKPVRPFIDIGDCTLNAAADARVVIELE